jgi:hypothetical protein
MAAVPCLFQLFCQGFYSLCCVLAFNLQLSVITMSDEMLRDREDEMERLDEAHSKALERIQAEAFESKLKSSSDILDDVSSGAQSVFLQRCLSLRCLVFSSASFTAHDRVSPCGGLL